MNDVIVFLQNAWSPLYAGGTWPRDSWLRALETSRSGQRLRILIVDQYHICENTTAAVASHPSGIEAPDAAHIRRVLSERKPRVVIACGKQAEIALKAIWTGPLLAVPHPAHRLLTDRLYKKARSLLTPHFTERMALRQGRGKVVREAL
jgi:hypothetical protein